MSAFSEMLSCEIKRHDISAMRISACTGISRANVTKILNGQKIPTHHELSLILSILPITQALSSTIMAELDNTRFGSSLCSQLEKLFKKMDISTQASQGYTSKEDMLNFDGIKMLEGKQNVLSFIHAMLHHEIIKAETPSIYTNITSDCPLAYELMTNALSSTTANVSLQISTKMNLHNNYGFENFIRLFEFAPFFMKKCDILYEYGNCTAIASTFGYTNFLIVHDTMIMTNQDTDFAIVINKESVLNNLKSSCETHFSGMRNLVRRFSTPFEFFDDIYKDSSKHLGYSYLQHLPCIPPYLEYEHFEQVARTDIPQVKAILPELFNHYNINKNGLNRGAFTLAGLYEFVQKGTLARLPDEYIKPVSKEIRIYGLEKMLESIEEGTDFRIINDSFLTIPQNTVIDLMNECQLTYTYQPPNIYEFAGQISFVTNEVTLLHEAAKFFDVLFESRYLHTRERSMEIIRQCIKDIK